MRPIDADRLKELSNFQRADFTSVESIIAWIDSQPSVIPEQETAEWIKIPDHKDSFLPDREIYCSKCGELALGYPFWEMDLYPSRYCPNCGRRMISCENDEETENF